MTNLPRFLHWGHTPIPTMPLFALISSRLYPSALVSSEAPLLSAPGSDQCFFSRSLVMWSAEPLGATRIPVLPLQERQPHLQLKRPPPTPLTRHQMWSSHLAFRCLPSYSAQESLKMPGRDKERLFPDCRQEEKGGGWFLKYLTAMQGDFVLFYIWCW